MSGIIPLEDRSAEDAAIVGAKAAGLARARRAGLPVLPGWIVPAETAPPILPDDVDPSRGPGAMSRMFETPLPAGLEDALDRLAHVGQRWIVRSSTSLDDDGRWAGAFSSYLDVESAQLPTAVRGCWSSLFTADAIRRGKATGITTRDIRLAVLIQPWRDFTSGGIARVGSVGVEVLGGAGPPHALLRGQNLRAAPVPPTDAVERLTRAASTATGATVVEWGSAGDDLVLLQVRREAVAAPAPASRATRRAVDDREVALARIVTRYPAPLGDDLVLPWALALRQVPEPARLTIHDPVEAMAEAAALARGLTATVWRASADDAIRCAEAAARSLLAGDSSSLPQVAEDGSDVHRAARILGLIEAVGTTLVASGQLCHPSDVWRLTRRELLRAVSSAWTPPFRATTRWDPFVAAVVGSGGDPRRGESAAPGVAAGRLHVVGSSLAEPGSRSVLAARAPLPHLAPLLWRASALVVAAGTPAAHLFEVARSLGVPAVIGVDLTREPSVLVAVNGWDAEVHVLPDASAREASTTAFAMKGG
jgi:hypothetical protein